MPTFIQAYGVSAPGGAVTPLSIKRRDLLPDDVRIDIKWTGICGTDLHLARNDWGRSIFPIVPGHEIVGVVSETGENVTKFRVGDVVAVGCIVDSCRACEECHDDHEQICLKGRVSTYNSPDNKSPGQATYGGYSEQILVHEHYVIRVPKSLSDDPELLKGVAPIACAGITTWVPLRRFGAGPGKKVGVVGLGGLGHMAVKLAHNLGAEVTVITRSHKKDAMARALGATNVVATSDAREVKAAARSFDLLIDTIPTDHNVNMYLSSVRSYGALVIVGHIGPLSKTPFQTSQIIFGNKIVAGSIIGGIKDTQELFDFCGENRITADVQAIRMGEVNEAWKRMDDGENSSRYVIDVEDFRNQVHKAKI